MVFVVEQVLLWRNPAVSSEIHVAVQRACEANRKKNCRETANRVASRDPSLTQVEWAAPQNPFAPVSGTAQVIHIRNARISTF